MDKENIADSRLLSSDATSAIAFDQASFGYGESGDAVVKDITLKVQPGEFVAIVGKVGSGKSSMVNALLGELKTKSGSLSVSGSMAYTAALDSWIQNTSLQNNILFGKPMNSAKYQDTLESCALLSDLDTLPGGDQTEIGERGINLSGGQKARVSLARAVYQDCDIYLLDDPLSSVDAHVGAHIFNNCFLGTLKSKTRILITHNTNFLHLVDRVIVLDSGTISEISEFNHLSINMQTIIDQEEVEVQNPESATVIGKAGDETKLVEEEDRKVGKVDLSTYLIYIRYAGGRAVFCIYVFAVFLWVSARFEADLTIKNWSESISPSETYLYWYLGFGSVATLALFFRAIFLMLLGVRAGTMIHTDMLNRLIRAPINLFYDITPIGRVINRLSQDQYNIDADIAFNINFVFTQVGSATGAIAIAVYFIPWATLLVVLLVTIGVYLQQVFLQVTRETTRLSHIWRSPLVQQFTETVTGLKTIRCFGKQEEFTEELSRTVNTINKLNFTSVGVEGWLRLWLEVMIVVFIVATAGYLVVEREEESPAVAALILTYMIPLGVSISFVMQYLADLETNMVSVERAHHMTQ